MKSERILKTSGIVKEIGICHAVVQANDLTKAFLVEDPKVSMKNGRFLKVPILTGVTKDEGSMLISGSCLVSIYFSCVQNMK